MKNIKLTIIFTAITLIGLVIDLLFSKFIISQVGILDNMIIAFMFTFILGYSDYKRRTHICHYTIPVKNEKVNENVRALTHRCVCNKENTETAHKDSEAYKRFIHEI